MDKAKATELAERIMVTWSEQDVEAVVDCYTDDMVYIDPNTRGEVQGPDAMRRYLSKLFGRWEMTWTLREAFPLADQEGAAVLWHATFRKPGSDVTVETDGMDFVLVRGDRIQRNEVRFDRAVLAPLMT